MRTATPDKTTQHVRRVDSFIEVMWQQAARAVNSGFIVHARLLGSDEKPKQKKKYFQFRKRLP